MMFPNASTAADTSHSVHDWHASVGVATARTCRNAPFENRADTRHATSTVAVAYRKRQPIMCPNTSTTADISHSAHDRRAAMGVAAARACATGPVRHRANTRHPTLAMAAAYRERPPKMCPDTSTAADISDAAHDKRAPVTVEAARACLTGALGTREKTRHPTSAAAAAYRERPPIISPKTSTAADISHSARQARRGVCGGRTRVSHRTLGVNDVSAQTSVLRLTVAKQYCAFYRRLGEEESPFVGGHPMGSRLVPKMAIPDTW